MGRRLLGLLLNSNIVERNDDGKREINDIVNITSKLTEEDEETYYELRQTALKAALGTYEANMNGGYKKRNHRKKTSKKYKKTKKNQKRKTKKRNKNKKTSR